MNFSQQLSSKIAMVDEYLEKYIPLRDNYQSAIYEAMRYSLFAGGKRLRPVIALASCELVGGNIKDAVPIACALEMIHTYSLIHDDLPAMDNDDYRRGKPTNHKVYGEAVAILAGDALLNKAFEVAVNEGLKTGVDPARLLKAISVIATASGADGMIGGQIVDLESENKEIDLERLKYMHLHKTGALIVAAAKAGAIIGGANEVQIHALSSFAENLGLAFQIKDDLLDVEGNQEKLGKPVFSDIRKGKSTFVSLMGIEESRKAVDKLSKDAVECLKVFGDKGAFLSQLAQYLIHREN